MVAHSVRDVRSYRRCPLAYTLGGMHGDGITSEECLDLCVRRAVHEAGRERILGNRALLDRMLDTFHSSWETEFKRIIGDAEDMTVLGERCISNYLHMIDRNDRNMAYSGVHSNLLPSGHLRVKVDEVSVRGNDVTLCRYVTNTR